MVSAAGPGSGAPPSRQDTRQVLGRVAGAHGVRGWVRVQTFTEDAASLLRYPRWMLGGGSRWRSRDVAEGRPHARGLVVRFEGVTDRDEALELTGLEIAVWRSELPPLGEEEYYWADIEGLTVVTMDGTELGRVERLFATGANDVMVVRGERERLVPFVLHRVVRRVDTDSGTVEVDWDPEF